MPTVLYSPSSPYSAKVRMTARAAGFAVDARIVNTGDDAGELKAANPLGKIPVLVLDDGGSVYDSRAITQYINRVSGGAVFPRNAAKRTEAETLEALADGINDCLLAHVYERRFRPDDKVHQPWLDKQLGKALSGLDLLNANPPKMTKKPTVGQIAVRAMLGYATLRFEGKWERGRSRFVRWAKRFDERFPELAELLPTG